MNETIKYQTRNQELVSDAKLEEVTLDEKNCIRIEWGQDNTYTLYRDDEDFKRIYERHSEPVIGITKLKYPDKSFMTIGLDHQIQVNSNYGRQLYFLNEHTDRIQGVILLNQDRKFISLGLDNLLCIWNLESGEQVVQLNGRKEAITNGRWLKSDRWLFSGGESNPEIWSEEGDLVYRFEFPFNSEIDFFEINDEQFLISKPDKSLSLWDKEGHQIYKHESDDEIIKLFHVFISATAETKKFMLDKPNFTYFEHFRNPIESNGFIAIDEIEKQKIDIDNQERKVFWDFFYRPIRTPIKTALKNIIFEARSSIKNINETNEITDKELESHKKVRCQKAKWSWFWLVIATITAGMGGALYVVPEFVMSLALQTFSDLAAFRANELFVIGLSSFFTIAAVSMLFTLILFNGNRKHKKLQLQKENNLSILKLFPVLFENLISNIKNYRTGILKSLPVRKDPGIFAGHKVFEAMKSQMTSLEEMALDECGLERCDIIYTDNQAIVLKDWALIQDDEKRKHVESKLNKHNERSFCYVSGEIIFAVQFIQFIFLTDDKIDIFTTYYDYISGKSIGKEANAFYYKDVTNISKREVERSGYSSEEIVSASEITLSVASGEKISLTILNEESVNTLTNLEKDNESFPIETRIEKLKKERLDYQKDNELSEEEKEEEISSIDAEINDLKNRNIENNIEKTVTKADEAIQNIRSMLRQHKQNNSKVGEDTIEVIS